MYKLLKTFVPVIIVLFVATYVLPVNASAADRIKAEDNVHVTYSIDHGGDIKVDQKFNMTVAAYYDDVSMTNLTIKDLNGFQLITSTATGEFQLQAPHFGGKEYMLLMEGDNNGEKADFKIAVPVYNAAGGQIATPPNAATHASFDIVAVLLVVGLVVVAVAALSAIASIDKGVNNSLK